MRLAIGLLPTVPLLVHGVAAAAHASGGFLLVAALFALIHKAPTRARPVE